MKYRVSTWTENEEEIAVTVSCRRNASNKTLFRKCATEIYHELFRRGLTTGSSRFSATFPNIWTNGYCGSLCLVNPYYNITITENNGDGCIIAQ